MTAKITSCFSLAIVCMVSASSRVPVHIQTKADTRPSFYWNPVQSGMWTVSVCVCVCVYLLEVAESGLGRKLWVALGEKSNLWPEPLWFSASIPSTNLSAGRKKGRGQWGMFLMNPTGIWALLSLLVGFMLRGQGFLASSSKGLKKKKCPK